MVNIEKLFKNLKSDVVEITSFDRSIVKRMTICESGVLFKATIKYLNDSDVSCISRDSDIFSIEELEKIIGKKSSLFTLEDLKKVLINF